MAYRRCCVGGGLRHERIEFFPPQEEFVAHRHPRLPQSLCWFEAIVKHQQFPRAAVVPVKLHLLQKVPDVKVSRECFGIAQSCWMPGLTDADRTATGPYKTTKCYFKLVYCICSALNHYCCSVFYHRYLVSCSFVVCITSTLCADFER